MSLSVAEENELLALLEAERRERMSFGEWLAEVTPYWTWDWPHQLYIERYLNEMTAGRLKRLMLFIPPQHGKSEMVTVRYPVRRLELDPGLRVVIAAYNQMHANRFSRRARRIVEIRQLGLAGDRAAVEEWETPAGGGVRAVGVGSGVTGNPCDLLVIDDPVKSREEAESPTYRNKVWDWYTDDLYTRLQQDAAVILIMTRWHEDDLAGRLLVSDDAPNWTVINLPAEAEENDPLGRAIGEPLCPARFDLTALADKRRVLGSYGYAALYQQRPAPREGGLFKREWFEILRAAPATGKRVRFWDLAASANEGDWTVGLLMSRTDGGLYYIEDVRRVQLGPLGVEQLVKQTADLDGGDVQIWMEQEPGSSGKNTIDHYTRTVLSGYAFRGVRSTGDKAVRADPLSAQAEAGNVKLVKGAWNDAWLDEVSVFPNGAHDDQVDGASGAFARLIGIVSVGIGRLETLAPDGEAKDIEAEYSEDAGWL